MPEIALYRCVYGALTLGAEFWPQAGSLEKYHSQNIFQREILKAIILLANWAFVTLGGLPAGIPLKSLPVQYSTLLISDALLKSEIGTPGNHRFSAEKHSQSG